VVVASVAVTPGTASVPVGATTTLTATPRDASNTALTGRSITWSTNAAAVATVANGVVTAVSAGSAVITATSEGKSGTATITVTPPPPAAVATVVVSPTTASVQVGGTTTLTAETRAANNAVLTGRVITWSTSSSAIATVANGVVTAVSAGTATITATSEGQNGTATVTVTAPQVVALAVSAGRNHSCAILTGGVATCWGLGTDGALGRGGTTGGPVPAPVGGGHTFVAISAGGRHTCGIDNAGRGWCWGHNAQGQLGNGSTTGATVPVAVGGNHTFARISAGNFHTCAVTTVGTGLCWGENSSAQLGVENGGVNLATPAPVLGGHAFAEISAGYDHSCGVTTANQSWCWGSGFSGILGNGIGVNAQGWWWFLSATPVAVTTGLGFTSIATGAEHSCALTLSGQVACWGSKASGQTGVGFPSNDVDAQLVPGMVSGPSSVTAIAAGRRHTCARSSTGAVRCWGSGFALGAGPGVGNASFTPMLVSGGHNFSQISAGFDHSCGVTAAGAILCWGSGADGKIGDPTQQIRFEPFPVM
jgi:alpha-tubulin suppressor-like RCC1 family protein